MVFDKKRKKSILLVYLAERSKEVKSSTLWSIYSMLTSTLKVKENVDIRKVPKLVPFLKKTVSRTSSQVSVGHQAKKSMVLTREQINHFLTEADDNIYLLVKTLFLNLLLII